MDGFRIELADPQGQLLEEIADPMMTRRDVALTYAFALRDPDRVDWPAVNGAIVNRWSMSALGYIKDVAWKLHAGKEPSRDTCNLCSGTGLIPGVAWPVGPLDELPCPECSGSIPNR